MTEQMLWAVVVLYNRSIVSSVSCEALYQARVIPVLAVDNSTLDMGNEVMCRQRGWEYVSMGGNMGLPKAYNRAVDYLRSKADAILLLDDDTTIDDAFIKTSMDALERYPAGDVFVPVVCDERSILSPCNIPDGILPRRVRGVDQIRMECVTAINSGMVIRMRVFKDFRYDENMFLDYVDHAFMRKMRKRSAAIILLNTRISQHFSGNDRSDLRGAIKRYDIFKKDFLYFCGRSPGARLFGNLVLLKRRISLCMKYRNLEFLLRRS